MGLIKKQQQKNNEAIITLRKIEPSAKKNVLYSSIDNISLQSDSESLDLPIDNDYQDEVAVQQECQLLLQQAKTDAEVIRRKAKEEGLEIGRTEGKAEYAEKCSEAMGTLAQAIKQKNLILREAEGDILQLAIKVAAQIIRSEISLNQAVCLNIIAEAINKVTDRDQVIVKVSSSDLELVKRNRERLSSLIDGVKSFSIVEDSQVEAGGCIVETNLGYIDARIHTRLEAIEAAVMKVHETDKKSETSS